MLSYKNLLLYNQSDKASFWHTLLGMRWGVSPRAAVLAQGKTNDSGLSGLSLAVALPSGSHLLQCRWERLCHSGPIRWGLVVSAASSPALLTNCTPCPAGGLCLQRQEQVFQRFGPHFSRQQQRDKLWAELLTWHFEIPSYFERIRISHRHSGSGDSDLQEEKKVIEKD